MTDQDGAVLDVAQANILSNGLTQRIRTRMLDWDNPHTFIPPSSYDMVVGADCVYHFTADAFTKALIGHVTDDQTEVYLSYRHRTDDTLGFFRSLVSDHGFEFHRLQDGNGRAVAPGSAEPSEWEAVFGADGGEEAFPLVY